MICHRCGGSYTEKIAVCPICCATLIQPQEVGAAVKSSSAVETPAADNEPFAYDKQSLPPVRYGGFWIRFWALMIDGAVLGCISLLVYGLAVSLTGSSLTEAEEPARVLFRSQLIANTFMKAFYFIYFHAVTGQTLGKKALGLKVVRETGERIGWTMSTVRYIGSFISLLAFGLGYLWVAFDSRKQGWHDKMAACFVVRV